MVNPFRRLFSEPVQPINVTKVIHVQPIGSAGTANYSGYTREEYLDALQGTQRADLYDKMERSDPQISMCLSAVKAPILAALWEIEPFDPDNKEAVNDANLVRHIIFEAMEKSFSETLEEQLSFLEHGFYIGEIIDSINIGSKEFGSFNGIKSIAFRSQRTIERWNLNKETDGLKSVTQYASGDLMRHVEIPAEHLMVITLKKKGANFEGVSAIRCCYGNWWRKNNYLKLNAIGIEKFAIPTPIVHIPDGKEQTDQFVNLTAALEAYCAHEKGYLTIPVGWEIDLNNNVYDPQKVEVSIDNEDKRMVKAFMANFLELGINGFGSQSLSFDLSDFFLGSVEHIAKKIAESWNKVIIPRLVKNNLGERDKYPIMKASGISDQYGQEFANMMKAYVDGKMITPDEVLETHLRKKHNLPKASEDTRRGATPVVPEETDPDADPTKKIDPITKKEIKESDPKVKEEEPTPKLSENLASLWLKK